MNASTSAPAPAPIAGAEPGELNLHPVERILGHRFRDQSLLSQALRHASVTDSRVKSNERLEFLGDAVLGLVVCQRTFEKFPHLLEGEMTKIKSAVVSRQTCAQLGKQLGLEEHLTIGKGMKSHDVLPQSLAAAAVESLVAALYLDAGLDAARRFLLPLLESRIDAAAASGHQENFKSLLQQHAQQRLAVTPEYQIVGQRGPDHAKHFQVRVRVGERTFEACWGASKKQAEQAAALVAMRDLGLACVDDTGQVRLAAGVARPTASEPAPVQAAVQPPAA
jgi:ribonuclease-3